MKKRGKERMVFKDKKKRGVMGEKSHVNIDFL